MSEYLKSIVDLLKDSATVKTVFGDPVSVQGRTVIPVARIAYGFGGGGGKGLHKEHPGEGEGGGGGLAGIPLGVIEVTADHTAFLPLHETRKPAAVGLGGLCVGLLLAKWAKRRRSRP